MTRKEAIKRLKEARSTIQPYRYVDEALDMAINSLKIDERYELEYKQIEPCEDAISRQAAEEMIKAEMPERGMWEIEGDKEKETVCEVCVSLIQKLSDLPPVKPQELKTGHWVNTDETHSKCDRCGAVFIIISANGEANYCPNCGAKMEGVQNDN